VKNKILYRIITSLWVFVLAFYIVLGFIVDSLIEGEKIETVRLLFDLYQVSSFVIIACITFLLLSTFVYHIVFHLAFLLSASIIIVFFFVDVYFRYTYELDGDSYLVSTLTMLLHLFVFNATLKNLRAERVKKGLSPLSFL